MSKRELQIPIDNNLTLTTKEDLIFRSPSTIPDKGLRGLSMVKKIVGSNCSYYDLSPTENQSLKRGKNIATLTIYPSNLESISVYTNVESETGELMDRPNPNQEDIVTQFDLLMGEINE